MNKLEVPSLKGSWFIRLHFLNTFHFILGLFKFHFFSHVDFTLKFYYSFNRLLRLLFLISHLNWCPTLQNWNCTWLIISYSLSAHFTWGFYESFNLDRSLQGLYFFIRTLLWSSMVRSHYLSAHFTCFGKSSLLGLHSLMQVGVHLAH